MNISKVSDYLHVYEAYRTPGGDKAGEGEEQGKAGRLVLTEKAQKQLEQDRANYSELLRLQEDMANAKQAGEAMKEEMEEYAKILEIFRRISKGDTVPSYDEKKLMEYDQKLYMAAKTAQMMAKNREKEEHESLWKDEEEDGGARTEPVDAAQGMKEFKEAQAANVVEVSAGPPEGADTGNGASAPVVDISI